VVASLDASLPSDRRRGDSSTLMLWDQQNGILEYKTKNGLNDGIARDRKDDIDFVSVWSETCSPPGPPSIDRVPALQTLNQSFRSDSVIGMAPSRTQQIGVA